MYLIWYSTYWSSTTAILYFWRHFFSASVIGFHRGPIVRFNFWQSPANSLELGAKILSVEPQLQGHALASGIKLAQATVLTARGGYQNAPVVVVVVTDSPSSETPEQMLSVATSIKLSAKLFSVGIGNNASSSDLTILSSGPNTHFVSNDTSEAQLLKTASMVRNSMCRALSPVSCMNGITNTSGDACTCMQLGCIGCDLLNEAQSRCTLCDLLPSVMYLHQGQCVHACPQGYGVRGGSCVITDNHRDVNRARSATSSKKAFDSVHSQIMSLSSTTMCLSFWSCY